MRKPDPSLVALALVAVVFAWSQIVGTQRQTSTETVVRDTAAAVKATAAAVKATNAAVKANCTVVSVLLANRADRDKTTKLFEPIRRENPEQFDALVKKAAQGDERLARVQGDLACGRTSPVPFSGMR